MGKMSNNTPTRIIIGNNGAVDRNQADGDGDSEDDDDQGDFQDDRPEQDEPVLSGKNEALFLVHSLSCPNRW